MSEAPTSGLRREARIDLDAFAENLRILTADRDEVALDVRADAYGHGLSNIVPVAMALGISRFLASGRTALPPAGKRRALSAAAYGLDPEAETAPVMTLVGEVVSVKRVPPGSGVSYGYSYRTDDTTTLALVGLGYADGVPRLASNVARVAIAGGLHPLVGRVAMDQFVVDLQDATTDVGAEAVVFGVPASGHPSAVDWGTQTGRSALELTAGIGPRVHRVVVGSTRG